MERIPARQRRRGFNLIEAAIVLGVVGLVIGGIWISAAAVSFHFQEQKFLQGFITQKINVEKYLSQNVNCGSTMVAGGSGDFFRNASPSLYNLVRPKEWDEIDSKKFCNAGCITTSVACDANGTRYYAVFVKVTNADTCYRYYNYLQERRLLLGTNGTMNYNTCHQVGNFAFNVFYEIPRRS